MHKSNLINMTCIWSSNKQWRNLLAFSWADLSRKKKSKSDGESMEFGEQNEWCSCTNKNTCFIELDLKNRQQNGKHHFGHPLISSIHMLLASTAAAASQERWRRGIGDGHRGPLLLQEARYQRRDGTKDRFCSRIICSLKGTLFKK
jgi:hypothetical protein